MSAQDMYPWSSRYSVRQYLSMCEDIDNLSAENKRLREASSGMSKHIVRTGIRLAEAQAEVAQLRDYLSEGVSQWASKRPSEWTPEEQEYVRGLVHGGTALRYNVEGEYWQCVGGEWVRV